MGMKLSVSCVELLLSKTKRFVQTNGYLERTFSVDRQLFQLSPDACSADVKSIPVTSLSVVCDRRKEICLYQSGYAVMICLI